jgi:hypothetical protein
VPRPSTQFLINSASRSLLGNLEDRDIFAEYGNNVSAARSGELAIEASVALSRYLEEGELEDAIPQLEAEAAKFELAGDEVSAGVCWDRIRWAQQQIEESQEEDPYA